MLLKELAQQRFRVIDGDSVRLGGKTFSKARVDRNDNLVVMNADYVEELWKGTQGYVGPAPEYKNQIGDRIERFKKFYEENDNIHAGNVHISKRRNLIDFGDGRHRTRVLIEKGYDQIPLTMSNEALQNLKAM